MWRVLVGTLLLLNVSSGVWAQEVERSYDRFGDSSSASVKFELPAPEGLRLLNIEVSAHWKGPEAPSDPLVVFRALWAEKGRQYLSIPRTPMQCIIDGERQEFRHIHSEPSTGAGAVFYRLGLDGVRLLAEAENAECRAGAVEFAIDANGLESIQRLHRVLSEGGPQ